MLIIPRRAALILFVIAAFNLLSGLGWHATSVWWLAAVLCVLYVQYYRKRGDNITRARLWYATRPLWFTGLIPVVLAIPTSWFEKTVAVLVLTGAAIWANSVARAHEHLMDSIHGPFVPRHVFG